MLAAALLVLGRAGHGRAGRLVRVLARGLLALLAVRGAELGVATATAVRVVAGAGRLRLAVLAAALLVLAALLVVLGSLLVAAVRVLPVLVLPVLVLPVRGLVLAVGGLLPVPLLGAGRGRNPRWLLVVVRRSLPAAAPGARQIGPAAQAEQIALLEGLVTDRAIQGRHDTSPARTPARSSVDVR
ncbi:hypothetical protein [Spirillospora sp. NPDC029432]|uniref:hypothetical protein n=1 Tax=Spirillospora sp. NPDC029432 TaxID=3154599 RepID=UPI0034558DD8